MTSIWLKFVALAALTGLLTLAVWEMRDFGDPYDKFDGDPSTKGKIHLYDRETNTTIEVNRTYMDEWFLDNSQGKNTSTNNAVTAIVFDWRGFDTLGEGTVLFSAVMGVLVALRVALPKKKENGGKGGDEK